MRNVLLGVIGVLLVCSAVSLGETLQIEGSTTVGPIADAFAKVTR